MGFLPPDDEHIKATVLGIADELTREGLVLRYRVEETDKVSLFCRDECAAQSIRHGHFSGGLSLRIRRDDFPAIARVRKLYRASAGHQRWYSATFSDATLAGAASVDLPSDYQAFLRRELIS
jgi:hypothetical protein